MFGVLKYLLFGAIFFLASLGSINASAFGGFGHMLICEIAYREMKEETRIVVNRLVRAQGEYTSFNHSCKFADRKPRKHSDWHYANYSRETSVISNDDCLIADECIFTGIKDELSDLANSRKSDAEKGRALVLLGHWIGDLHQPLHLSYKDDQGGNLVAKRGVCSARNLHAVWDSCILEREIAPVYGWKERFGYSENTRIYRAVDRIEKTISKEDREDWVKGDYFDWANESYQITLHPDVGYCVKQDGACWYDTHQKKLKEDDEPRKVYIDEEYLKLWAPVVEQRLKKAGVRLAHVFDKALEGI